MSLVGLDLNSSRVRAVNGALGDYPLPLPLSVSGEELPLVLSLQAKQVEVGAAGEHLRRRLPHLTCHGFLPHLGAPRRWKAGRHDLDSAGAVEQVWRHLGKHVAKSNLVLSLPPYLSGGQADQVRALAQKSGIQVLGSLPSTLAAALAGYADDHWVGGVMVLDVDEHALSAALIEAVDHTAFLRETISLPQFGWHAWRDRLLDSLADGCVLQTRRDPRESGQAEQGLYEQLGLLLDAHAQNRLAQLTIQGASWFQNLIVTPEETAACCRLLVAAVTRELHELLASLHPERLPHALLLTAEADRLPGLTPALAHLVEPFRVEAHNGMNGHHRPPSDDDFGINLLRDSGEDRWHVVPLGKNACAQAAHALAAFFQKGDLPAGHLETSAPLPLAWPIEAGPARLTFQGRDHFLGGSTFLIGTESGCHLRIDPAHHPGVAGRHCEVYYDHRTYVLFNRSEDGTWINDAPVQSSSVLHPGDRIRLGVGGPVIKFLGQPPRS
ncbi:MAG: FHA domain-containing protein [Gemmataceae bacterium]